MRSRAATVPARCAATSGWNRSCPPNWASGHHLRRSCYVSGCSRRRRQRPPWLSRLTGRRRETWTSGRGWWSGTPNCEALLDVLRGAVEHRRGGIVLVSGEAGAGKSALVTELIRRVTPDVRTLVGGCDDLLAPPSLGPFRDMADHHPELASALSCDRPQDAVPALLRVFARQPSAVVIEDLHWADDATLDAIRYLARRFASTPSALVLTFRETGVDAGHPLRQLLGSLVGPAVHRVTLPPLSVHGVRRLGVPQRRRRPRSTV